MQGCKNCIIYYISRLIESDLVKKNSVIINLRSKIFVPIVIYVAIIWKLKK